MTDPNDTFEDDLKTIQYNKAIDALIPMVMEDPVFFDAFIQGERPDIYNAYDEDRIKELHISINYVCNNGFTQNKMAGEWMKYVEAEAERRVIG